MILCRRSLCAGKNFFLLSLYEVFMLALSVRLHESPSLDFTKVVKRRNFNFPAGKGFSFSFRPLAVMKWQGTILMAFYDSSHCLKLVLSTFTGCSSSLQGFHPQH